MDPNTGYNPANDLATSLNDLNASLNHGPSDTMHQDNGTPQDNHLQDQARQMIDRMQREYEARDAARAAEQLKELNDLKAQIIAQGHTPALPKISEKLIQHPKKFDGTREDLANFTFVCDRIYESYPNIAPSDLLKINFEVHLFSGEAFHWINNFMRQEPRPLWLHSHLLYRRELETAFSEGDIKEVSRRKIAKLTQTTSVTNYATDFRRHATYLDWSDESLRQSFFDGLKEDIKDHLLTPDNYTRLDTLVEDAGRYDSLLSQRRKSTALRHKVAVIHPTRTTATISTHTPMEVDATVPRRGPLSQKEKDRRRANNLCSYCGEGGHFADRCPKIPGRVHALSYQVEDSDQE